MVSNVTRGREPERVRQFSVFIANRLGRLHDLIALLAAHDVHVLAMTILDTTDSAIVRLVTDDPQKGRELLKQSDFAFTESELLVVELDSATDLNRLVAALLEAEINIHYLYSFIPQLHGKSIIGLSMEDTDVGETALRRHQFSVLMQSDILR